ncbi:Uma2 family endonuclease [Streptomyces sp. NPDC021225]|uniref:Uma2 family endonuclease n=1 Tax=unclassified Streptomyces TaxID=2593676 RepID=UPI0037AEBB5D
MSATAEPRVKRKPLTLLEEANLLMDRLPGWRAEIIGGVLTVTALPDMSHAVVLTDLMGNFFAADLHGQETEVIQRIGVWLPTGPDDYAIPDLAIVDADIMEHQRENNCYGPEVFRLIVEVTSNNYNNDLRNKVAVYAEAKIPVYLIVNRKHGQVHVLTDPGAGGYDTHCVHAPGEQITLPDSIGAKVTLDVSELLQAGRQKG